MASKPKKKKGDDDDFEDEEFVENAGDAAADPALEEGVEARLAEVKGLLDGNNLSKAFTVALADPPVTASAQSIKDKNATIVVKCINRAKDTDVDKIIASLSSDQQDILMQYIYRLLSLEIKDSDSGKLLKWHGKLKEAAGLGSIVRALTTRTRV